MDFWGVALSIVAIRTCKSPSKVQDPPDPHYVFPLSLCSVLLLASPRRLLGWLNASKHGCKWYAPWSKAASIPALGVFFVLCRGNPYLCVSPPQVSLAGYGMDEAEQDQYEARLKELFDSFDSTGTGSLGQEELTDLCHVLHLEEVAPALQQTLLQGNLLGRVRLGLYCCVDVVLAVYMIGMCFMELWNGCVGRDLKDPHPCHGLGAPLQLRLPTAPSVASDISRAAKVSCFGHWAVSSPAPAMCLHCCSTVWG